MHFTVLNDPEKFGLHGQGGFANFVEKHRAAIGVFEKSRTGIGGAGECATNMAEELAFEQGIDHSGTVAYCQALLADRAKLVDGAGDQFFAGAGGAGE